MSRLLLVLVSLVVILAVAACGGGGGGGAMTVRDAWVRAAPAGGESAAYLTVDNGTGRDDALVQVDTVAARSASIHETSTDASGMTGMHHVDGVPVKAGGSARLEPGGFHVMLEGLTTELRPGASIPLVLTFQGAGRVEVTADVVAN